MYQDFATVDLLSGGRAEIIVGRGAFTESFALFGYSLEDYNALFVDHLDLLLAANEHERVTWQGRFRPALHDAEITPRALQPKLPIWIGLAGSPESAARAGSMGLPMIVGLIGGLPSDVAPGFRAYRAAAQAAGHDPAACAGPGRRATCTSRRRRKARGRPSTSATPTTSPTSRAAGSA